MIIHFFLPEVPDLSVNADDQARRMSEMLSMLDDPRSFAPPWRVVFMGAAYEVPFALVGGVAGAALVAAGWRLRDTRRATQVAVGGSAAVAFVLAILVLRWIDRPPRRAADAAPGPVVEMRLVHDPSREQSEFVVWTSPGPHTKQVPTLLDPSETVKMRLEDRGRMHGYDIMVHDRLGLVILGTDIAGAEAGFSGSCGVRVRLTAGGSRKLEEFTRRNVGRRVAVIAYGRLLMAPTIMEPLSGSIHLSVGPKKEDAIVLAARINGLEPPAADAE